MAGWRRDAETSAVARGAGTSRNGSETSRPSGGDAIVASWDWNARRGNGTRSPRSAAIPGRSAAIGSMAQSPGLDLDPGVKSGPIAHEHIVLEAAEAEGGARITAVTVKRSTCARSRVERVVLLQRRCAEICAHGISVYRWGRRPSSWTVMPLSYEFQSRMGIVY